MLLLPLTSSAQTSEDVLNKYFGLGLPLVCVTTVDGSEPTSTNIMHPEGNYIGASITDIVPKEARMQIYRADTLWYDSGEYRDDKSGIKIKHRGNTSAYYMKNKPFKLSLQKKADLMEAVEGDDTDRRSKDWVLLNNTNDMNVWVASQMSRLIDMEFTPRMEFVNVIINDDYRGTYILSENVKRDKDCRVDVDKDEGYIIELDAYFWNESFSIPSKLNQVMQWTLKYPKAEDLTEEQEANIRNDIERLEESVSSDNYPEVIDVQSFARWILLHDILGTYDSGGSNIYVARQNQEPTSLMRMPVAWDMGVSMAYPDEWSMTHTVPGLFFYSLFANENVSFLEAYVEEWERVKQSGAMEQILQYLQSFPSTAQGQGLTRSYPLHAQRWECGLPDVDEMIQAAIEWFADREEWLNSKTDTKNAVARKLIVGKRIYIIKDGKTYSVDGKRIN